MVWAGFAPAAALVVVVLTLAYFIVGVGGGCSSREDVTARVGTVSSALQQAAAQGKLSIEQLAESIKRLNSAATDYETSQNHHAYCESLDNLREELPPAA